MLNALTIDVEDYFQVHAFSDIISYEDWDKYECRIERNTHRILEILSDSSSLVPRASSLDSSNLEPRTLNVEPRTSVRATFFCLGWIAERYPHLIKEIHSQGHEIACHGYAHRLIYLQSPEEFRADIHKAKLLLEDIIGKEVIGYRAPSYSITTNSLWAFGILAQEGFQYDSSIFPIRHDFYGIYNAPRFPFVVSLKDKGTPDFIPLTFTNNPEPRTLNLEHQTSNDKGHIPQSAIRNPNWMVEFPLSTLHLGRINFPISGGGYFRLFPYWFIRMGLKRINEREKRPFIFYLHPWEMDETQPRIREARMRSRLRHYVNLQKTEGRFKKLIEDFDFVPAKNLLNIIPLS